MQESNQREGERWVNKKNWQGALGLSVFALFVLTSVLINQKVQAVNQAVSITGYYYNHYASYTGDHTSDALPAAPGSLSCTSSVCSWTAPTLTNTGTAIATGGGTIDSYYINYSTSSLTSCSGGSQLTSTTTSKTLENVTAGATWYVAVCARDNNGNTGVAATTSFTTSASSSSSGGGGGGSSIPPSTPNNTSGPSNAPTIVEINQILAESQVLSNVQGLLHSIGVAARNNASEKSYEARIKTLLGKIGDAEMLEKLVNFVTYGTSSTQVLGAGERLGVLNSYRAAYGKNPSTEAEWSDAIKIANGRWPSETNAKAEARAKATFKTIYKHNADMSNANENASVTVMAYGLRPANRNLNSEKVAVKNFRGIFGRAPSLATDWDMVRAIAYSGAKR